LWSNIARLGRNTYFSQTLNVTYTLPTQKFPFLDWTRATATYASTYNWTAASRLAYEQGNIIANTQLKQINGEFTFSQLYNKSRWLKAINAAKVQEKSSMFKSASSKSGTNQAVNAADGGKSSGIGGDKPITQNGKDQQVKEVEQKRKQPELPPRPERKEIDKSKIPGADTMTGPELRTAYKALKKAERQRFRKELAAWRAKRRNIVPEIPQGVRVAGRLITMLKRVTVNYSENAGTILPGFMDSTQFLGVNSRSSGWYDFAFGNQPDRAWFDQQAALQRISRDELFNGQLQQTYSQNYSLQATLEPAPDFRIDLMWNKQFSKNYSETFKYNTDTSMGREQGYQHYSPYSMGTFSISYIGLKTMFTPSKANELSKPYQDFVNNGAIISRRLGNINPYTAGLPDPQDPDFTKGYTRYSGCLYRPRSQYNSIGRK
jgi:cell surface protein SprA